jgi:UV DNA damage endonuclease
VLRLGLCCIFREEPIRFRRATARSLNGLSRRERLARLGELALHNARSLRHALGYCRDRGIGDFRINSQILPLFTHPDAGYRLRDLPQHREIRETLEGCKGFARDNGLRSTFHPDQFVLLSSPSQVVTRRSLEELAYQAEVAELVGADVINLHAGGAYGDKQESLRRLRGRLGLLPVAVRGRLALENDDRLFSPRDLLPLCRAEGLPLVYDVHHHRCLPDGLSIAQVTKQALATWDREPVVHLSSPKHGWDGGSIREHHDFIDPADLPGAWLKLKRNITVEVEAKAKELAVLRLRATLAA